MSKEREKVISVNENITNGEMFMKTYPDCEVEPHIDSVFGIASGKDVKVYISKNSYFVLWFPSDWWNAPYKGDK